MNALYFHFHAKIRQNKQPNKELSEYLANGKSFQAAFLTNPPMRQSFPGPGKVKYDFRKPKLRKHIPLESGVFPGTCSPVYVLYTGICGPY